MISGNVSKVTGMQPPSNSGGLRLTFARLPEAAAWSRLPRVDREVSWLGNQGCNRGAWERIEPRHDVSTFTSAYDGVGLCECRSLRHGRRAGMMVKKRSEKHTGAW